MEKVNDARFHESKNSPDGEFFASCILRLLSRFLHRLHFLDEGLPCVGVLHRELGKNFPVELDIFRLFKGDEFPIFDTVLAEAVSKTDDPESSEGALLVVAVAIGVDTRLHDGFFGLREELASTPSVALGGFQDILVALLGHYAAFHSGHTRQIKM